MESAKHKPFPYELVAKLWAQRQSRTSPSGSVALTTIEKTVIRNLLMPRWSTMNPLGGS